MRKVLFKFSKSYGDDLNVHIEEWLEFPMTCTVFECSLQLASVHSIPEFAFGAFHEKLSDFISNENSNDFKDRYLHLVNNLKLNALNIEKLCSDFDSANHNDFLSSSKLAKLSDQQIFTHTFNRMIHSPAAQDFVHLEKSFAVAVGYELHKRNDVLKEMDQKHINETERGLQKRGSEMPETITQLQEGYYLKREIVESHWDSCISALKWEQRQALRKFVMSFEDHVQSLSTNNSQINFSQKDMKDSSPKASQSTKKSSLINNRPIFKRSDHIPLSETFTVQLGRQLRTVFNFRLTRMDPSELITDKRSRIQENHLPDENALAERMNNALNIYSNNLNGLVILVDKGVNSFRGIKRHTLITVDET
ncbi:unnamed protein product [Heterobilharzia americana]|nr:unnamed protein product [Heterobilharzia americana]